MRAVYGLKQKQNGVAVHTYLLCQRPFLSQGEQLTPLHFPHQPASESRRVLKCSATMGGRNNEQQRSAWERRRWGKKGFLSYSLIFHNINCAHVQRQQGISELQY